MSWLPPSPRFYLMGMATRLLLSRVFSNRSPRGGFGAGCGLTQFFAPSGLGGMKERKKRGRREEGGEGAGREKSGEKRG